MDASASVTLYDYPGSICCQMARLVLAEKGVPYVRRTVDIVGKAEQFEPWYLALNPRAVVPTLEVAVEGREPIVVTDTLVITEFIEENFPGPRLLPREGPSREEVCEWMRALMALRYGVLLYSKTVDEGGRSAVVVQRGEQLRALLSSRPELESVLAPRIAGNQRFQAALADEREVARVLDGVRELVEELDAALNSPFLVGDEYSIADAFACATLSRLRAHGRERWWTEGALPQLEAYFGRLQARESYAEAAPFSAG